MYDPSCGIVSPTTARFCLTFLVVLRSLIFRITVVLPAATIAVALLLWLLLTRLGTACCTNRGQAVTPERKASRCLNKVGTYPSCAPSAV